jgi:phage terminase Nu1 subunit (DNA packaging protein)
MTTNSTAEVDLQTASTLLRKAPNTLKAWFRQGCPVAQRGRQNKPWRINIGDVLEWREQQAVQAAVGDTSTLDIDEARRRKTAAEAALAELELGRRKSELLEVEAVEKAWTGLLLAFRSRMLSLPVKAAPLVQVCQTLPEIQEQLKRLIYEALTELSELSELSEADISSDEGQNNG